MCFYSSVPHTLLHVWNRVFYTPSKDHHKSNYQSKWNNSETKIDIGRTKINSLFKSTRWLNNYKSVKTLQFKVDYNSFPFLLPNKLHVHWNVPIILSQKWIESLAVWDAQQHCNCGTTLQDTELESTAAITAQLSGLADPLTLTHTTHLCIHCCVHSMNVVIITALTYFKIQCNINYPKFNCPKFNYPNIFHLIPSLNVYSTLTSSLDYLNIFAWSQFVWIIVVAVL